MTRITGLVTAAVLAIGLAAPAQAGFFSIVGGTAGTIPGPAGTNEYLTPLFGGAPSLTGYYGSRIDATIYGGGTITLEFFGAEAGFHNEFNFFFAKLFDHPGGTIIAPNLGSPLDTFSAPIIGAGTLLFSFEVDVDGTPGSVANGANPDDSAHTVAGPNFFASCAPTGPGNPTTCEQIYLFLDDSGAGPDDNHDDFLVRMTISATAVPEPTSLSLFGAGLLAAYIARRRRQK